MDNDELIPRYNWKEAREKRYLEAQWQILLIVGISALAITVLSFVAPPPTMDKGREVSIAAKGCFNQGMRAILHTDGSIECRP